MADVDTAAWRDSARSPRFFFVDANAALPLAIFFVHIRTWTFVVAIFAMVFFAILEKFKFTVPIFSRWVRATLAGSVRVSHPSWRD
jgi:intracellular multiplication protein IcmT